MSRNENLSLERVVDLFPDNLCARIIDQVHRHGDVSVVPGAERAGPLGLGQGRAGAELQVLGEVVRELAAVGGLGAGHTLAHTVPGAVGVENTASASIVAVDMAKNGNLELPSVSAKAQR